MNRIQLMKEIKANNKEHEFISELTDLLHPDKIRFISNDVLLNNNDVFNILLLSDDVLEAVYNGMHKPVMVCSICNAPYTLNNTACECGN